MRFFLFVAITCFFANPTQAEVIDVSGACSYFGEDVEGSVSTFGSTSEAVDALDKIVKATGLSKNFRIEAASVQNAMAVIKARQRYILYDPNFMLNMTASTGTSWAAISILAHEVGHHLNGHTLEATGSRPPSELEADKFSGFVLQKLGSNLGNATAAMKAFGSEQGSTTHPAKARSNYGWLASSL